MCQLCYFSFSFQKCFYLLVYCLFYSERYNFQVLFCSIFLFFTYLLILVFLCLVCRNCCIFPMILKKNWSMHFTRDCSPLSVYLAQSIAFLTVSHIFCIFIFCTLEKKSQSLRFDLGSSLLHLKCSYPLFYWFNLLSRLLFISSLKLVFFTMFLSFYLIQFTNP